MPKPNKKRIFALLFLKMLPVFAFPANSKTEEKQKEILEEGSRYSFMPSSFQQQIDSKTSPEMVKPILEPIAKMIDSFDPRVHRDGGGGGAERILRALRILPEPSTTTTPAPSPIERVFDPLFDSIRQGLRKMSFTADDSSLAKPSKGFWGRDSFQRLNSPPGVSFSRDKADDEFGGTKESVEANGKTQESPSLPFFPLPKMISSTPSLEVHHPDLSALRDFAGPLKSLLETFGMNAPPRDSIQVGRDESISVLGMPIGRKDGLAISPLSGLSYGPTYSIGPLAINDGYTVKWDFLDKISRVFYT